jgi:hypothetical protein
MTNPLRILIEIVERASPYGSMNNEQPFDMYNPFSSGSCGCGQPSHGGGYPSYGGGSSAGYPSFSAGPNKAMQPWESGIEKASNISGLNPNIIGGQVWAESRGNPNTTSPNPDGKTTDVGLMQISQSRWEHDVCPHLTQEQRQKIYQETHKSPEQLNMNLPQDNLIGGALESAQEIQQTGSIRGGLNYYQSGDKNGNNTYANNVLAYARELASGSKLSEDPYGDPGQ